MKDKQHSSIEADSILNALLSQEQQKEHLSPLENEQLVCSILIRVKSRQRLRLWIKISGIAAALLIGVLLSPLIYAPKDRLQLPQTTLATPYVYYSEQEIETEQRSVQKIRDKISSSHQLKEKLALGLMTNKEDKL
jgi:hypothetical protein